MHHNSLINILLSILIFILIGSCNSIMDDPEDAVSLMPGDKLPYFSVVCHNGETLSTEMLRGKRSVIVFFDTACGDCRKALPEIQKAYDEAMATHPDEVTYICISRNEDAESVQKYWDENNLTLPYSAQTNADVYHLFANIGIPRVYISNTDLIIEKTYE